MRAYVVIGVAISLPLLAACGAESPAQVKKPDRDFPEIEQRLRPLAEPLPKPGPSDWLAHHDEPGQTFAEYRRARPIRKSEVHNRIFLCLIGDFSPEQEQVLDITAKYLEVFFQAPVEVHERLPLDRIPRGARRTHPTWGDKQILSTHVLYDVLKPDRPTNALAYIAFTASDLWPGEGWNFVFGQASLNDRVGVWSIYRNGDPAQSKEEFQLCLTRTMKTASHEIGHILGITHCIAHHCNMNGSNHRAESDLRPLHLCRFACESCAGTCRRSRRRTWVSWRSSAPSMGSRRKRAGMARRERR